MLSRWHPRRRLLLPSLVLALLAGHPVVAVLPSSKQQDIVIVGGTVVNADQSFQGDVLLQGGVITAVGSSVAFPAGALVLNATSMLVMPGGIDPHTHLDMPFMGAVTVDDFQSGQRAAVAGGTTYHLDFALPVAHDLMAGYSLWQRKAEAGCLDYSFHMAVTSWDDAVAAAMAKLAKEHGVNSFKFFLAYKGALMVTDAELLQGMRQAKALGALTMVHAEDGEAVEHGRSTVFADGVTGPHGHALSRPAAVEDEATGRAIALAGLTDAPLYIVHTTTAGAAQLVADARARGLRVMGEPVLSGLVLDESVMRDDNFTVAAAAVMSPPIRKLAVDGVALRAGLATGVLGPLGTDHCSFNSTQKAQGRDDFRAIPNGVNGIGERMVLAFDSLVASGLATPMEYVRAVSTTAAQTFNVYPRKGVIAVGSDADVVVFNPQGRTTISAATHFSKSDTNVYEGRTAVGRVVFTISRGRLLWADGELACEAGTSRYVATPPFSPYLFPAARPGASEERERDEQTVRDEL